MASKWNIQPKLKVLSKALLTFVLSFSLFSTVAVPAAQAGGYHKKVYGGHGHYVKKRYHHRRHYSNAHHYRGHRYHGKRHYGRHHYRRHHRRNHGAAIAAGFIGLAAGAIIASEVSKNRHRKHHYHNRTYRSNHVSYKPYSAGWYSACARKYRSFNHRTGRYLTYSGKYKLCRL